MKRYHVSSVNRYFEELKSFDTDNPLTALKKYFYYNSQPVYCTMTCIMCGSSKDCFDLYKTFVKNVGFFQKEYGRRYNFAYYYDYSKICMERLQKGITIGFNGSSDLYDQVPYFSLG